jgi:hypothetical protein
MRSGARSTRRVRVVAAFTLFALLGVGWGCGSPPPSNPWGSGTGNGSGNGGGGSASNPDGSISGPNPDGNVPPGNSNGGLLRDGAAGSNDGSSGRPCSPIGSTRVCPCGTQTCSGTAEFLTWGPCLDATGAPAVCPPSLPLPPPPCGTSETDASCDAAPPPDAGCGPGMVCKPGAVRYCDEQQISEWTKSTCDPTGNWGPCVPTIAPVGVGCSQASFSPEVCCPPLHLCCQNDPNGPWMDWSGGGCAIIKCP